MKNQLTTFQINRKLISKVFDDYLRGRQYFNIIEVAIAIQKSVRQTHRLLKQYTSSPDTFLQHGNVNHEPSNKINKSTVELLIHEYINFIKELKLSKQNKTLLTHIHFFKYSEIVKRYNLSYQVMNHYLNAFQKFSPLAHKKTKARYKRIFKNESKKNIVENN